MADHLKCIGLAQSAPNDLERFVAEILADTKNTEVLELAGGWHTHLWTDASGAGMAVHLTPAKQIACGVPFFRTKMTVPVMPTERIGDRKCRFCDRVELAIFDREAIASGNGAEMLYSLAVQAADIGLFAPQPVFQHGGPVGLSFFVESVRFWPDEATYDSSQAQSGGVKLASRSLIPSGLFTPARGAFAALTGVIESRESYTNELTGQLFFVLRVSTLGGSFDVPALPSQIPEGLREGAVIQGEFWVVTRNLKPAIG